jgi:hypothetical protein
LLASDLARVLATPVALLSRDQLGWRFEAHAFPSSAGETTVRDIGRCGTTEEAVDQLEGDSGHAWTAIALERIASGEWTLLGDAGMWSERSGFDQIVEAIRWSLPQVATKRAGRFRRSVAAKAARLQTGGSRASTTQGG